MLRDSEWVTVKQIQDLLSSFKSRISIFLYALIIRICIFQCVGKHNNVVFFLMFRYMMLIVLSKVSVNI